MSGDVRYLVFMPPLPGAEIDFAGAVAAFASRLGTVGDGTNRQLGFGNSIPFWGQPSDVINSINVSFAIARETGVAVHFTIDDHIDWAPRPDLWNWYNSYVPGYNPANIANVEWYSWDGSEVNIHRYLTPNGVPSGAPHMCYNSPMVLSAISQIISTIIAPTILANVAVLQAHDKEYLFAGITIGSELQIDDYSVVPDISAFSGPEPHNPLYLAAALMSQDSAPHARVGYNALLRNGFNSSSPPADINQALIEVNRQFILFWGQQFSSAGISSSHLYTHVAAVTQQDESNNAPIGVVFNPYSQPGWTTYPQGRLADGLQPLYDSLSSNRSWGGVEANAANTDPGSPPVGWAEYLDWHFNFGARLVGINVGASDPSLVTRLSTSAFGSAALSAYRRFLNGEISKKNLTGPPYPPLPGAGSNAIGNFKIGISSIGDIPPFQWWTTVISQYANSTVITQLIENFFNYVDQTRNLEDFFDLIWNVDTAEGYGLDVWGRIVGVNRVLAVIASPPYFGFDEASPGSVGWGQASFYSGAVLTNNFALSHEAFRLLIFAKALANITNGSIQSINQLLLNLFPNRGNCYVGIPRPSPYFGFAEANTTMPTYTRGWNDANISLLGYFGFAEASPTSNGWDQGIFFSLDYGVQHPSDSILYGPFYSGQELPHMKIEYVFEFPLTAVELAIVQNSGVLPKPVGVYATVVQD